MIPLLSGDREERQRIRRNSVKILRRNSIHISLGGIMRTLTLNAFGIDTDADAKKPKH